MARRRRLRRRLLGPIALQPGTEVEQEGWGYRLDRDDEKTWRLASRQGEARSDMYTFTLEGQLPIDYVVADHYTQSHPRSPFVGGPLIFANHGAFRHRLMGLELATEHPDGSRDPRAVDVSEIADVLAGTFGIVLDAAEASALRARLG